MADPYKKTRQAKEARLVVVGELYRKGYSFRDIRAEIIKRDLKDSYSLSTVKSDVDSLLAEWRKQRVDDVNHQIQLELSAIDDQLKELWIAWDRSKADQKLKSKKQTGIAAKTKGDKVVTPSGDLKDQEEKDTIRTTAIEQTEKEEINFGDVRYQDMINKLRMERRKLLGLYAVDKSELTLTGSVSIDKWLEDNSDDDEE